MLSSTTNNAIGVAALRLEPIPLRRFVSCRHLCAVSTPVEIFEERERQRIAEETGYRQIGKELPEGVTLNQVIQTLPKTVFEIDEQKAWKAVAITVGSTALSLGLIAISPWYLLPFAYALAGTAATGFFVIGHDCGHRSFSKNKWIEDVVGTILFAPLLYPFEPWRIKHNHHHAHTNKLVEDTAWHPVMDSNRKEWSNTALKLYILFMASPLKCWASIGHWMYYHFDRNKFTEKQMPRVIVSWLAVAAFAGGVLPWIGFTFGWGAVLKFWFLPWMGYHFWMSTFTVVHHTAPHIPFVEAQNWNAAKAQLSGSVHCDYPAWIDFLTHDISWHVPHHVSSKIPWYNLRTATESLRENWGEYMTECTFNWKVMKNIFTELHVYNEEKNYLPLDSEKESLLLKLQRILLPETA